MNEIGKNGIFLGIDTSNYTTSIALCDAQGNILLNLKKLLDVKAGERGLRQSDALFAHTKNIPELMSRLKDYLRDQNPNAQIMGVGYSDKPRNAEGSYMPCFLAGVSVASSIGASLGCEIYPFSHQDGHIMAAIHSSGKTDLMDNKAKFAAFHISGGTTELLLVDPRENGFDVELVGGSMDMNAGQAIDRTGVLMGLKFPCGRAMEEICESSSQSIDHIKSKISVDGLKCNLSGLENLASKLYSETQDMAYVSAFCFDFIANTLDKITNNLREIHPDIPVIFAGGVMSNKRIAQYLKKHGNVYFATPEFSSDNAAGVALLCMRKHVRNIE